MDLTMIISQAREGELDGLSQNKKTDQKIVNAINLGLIDLYSRFILDTEEIIVSLQDGKTIYSLDGTDTDVEVNNAPIVAGSILSLVEAWDEEKQIPINDDKDNQSIFQISYNKLQIPATADQSYISIIYKPVPVSVVFVDDGNGSAVTTDVPLPLGLLQPLLKFIAYRAHMSSDGTDGGEKDPYFVEYEQACMQAEARGLVPIDQFSRYVEEKGFI